MKAGSAQIVIQFKALPEVLYFKEGMKQEPNRLVIRIQPDTGVNFQFNTRDFGAHKGIVTTKMDTCYACPAQGNTPEAYERLLYDVFARRRDAVFPAGMRWKPRGSWRTPLSRTRQPPACYPNYDAGTMGPAASDALLARDGRRWWDEMEEWA